MLIGNVGGQKIEIRNQKWQEDLFVKERESVFAQWPSGKEIDIVEAVNYLKNLPRQKIYLTALEEAERTKSVHVSTRTGAPTIKDNISLLQHMEKVGNETVSLHVDSYTRWRQFEKAEELSRKCEETGERLLNGYPMVTNGLKACRAITEAVNVPVRAAIGALDVRLAYEMSVAGGCTEISVGIFTRVFSFPHPRVSLEEIIVNHQYLHRMIGWYEEQGVPVVLYTHGNNSGTIKLPSLALALMVVEVAAAAEQGVKNMMIGCYNNVCLNQDLATVKLLPIIARRYLDRLGYKDVHFFPSVAQWNGAFPREPSAAMAIICHDAVVAGLGKEVKEIITKSHEEALHIPSPEASAAASLATRKMIDLVKGQEYPREALEEEIHIIELETKCLVDNILDLGQGDPLVGAMRAYANGTMEWPLGTASKYSQNNVMLVRDLTGAVRLLDPGHLPFPDEVLRYHKRKIEEREKAETREADLSMVMDSMLFLEK